MIAVAGAPSSSRAGRLYPNVERVLAVYYALRMDWQSKSVQTHDGALHTVSTGNAPGAVSFMCDIGSAIESALTQYEREEVLPRRWHAYFRAQFAAGEQRRLQRNLCRCGERVIAHKLARQSEVIAKWDRESWEAECDRLSRRKAYRDATRKLDVELRARDLYARSLMGVRGAIPLPPEWGA